MNEIRYTRLFLDLIILQVAYILAGFLSGRTYQLIDLLIMAVMMTTWYFSNKVFNSYDEFSTESFAGELLLIIQNVVAQLVVISQVFFFLNQNAYARMFAMYYITILVIMSVSYCYLARKILLNRRREGGNRKHVVFIGYNEITLQLMDMISKTPRYRYKVLGVIAKKESHTEGLTYLGSLLTFYNEPLDHRIDEFIITSDKLSKKKLSSICQYAERKGIRTSIVPNYTNPYVSRSQFQLFGKYPIIKLRSEPLQQEYYQIVKRIIDITFCGFAFVFIFSWLFPIIAILVKISSSGPVFFKQQRWGKNGKLFMCYKFRSMRINMPEVNEKNEFMQASKSDPRITKFGAFLRKSSLDELPQFINVLLGDMSVVGPRPHAHEHNLRTQDKINSYLVRHWIKPGVTGWAQVNGYRGETKTDEEMQNRINFDIWYIEKWTFWIDIKIIFITVYNIVRGEDNAY
jgi:putative colanic acid biosynthesis UDP-glucose lipid carrier transferase